MNKQPAETTDLISPPPSVAGFIAGPFMAKYCSSKWALEAISDSARTELAHHGVSVSVVQPAYVKSEIFGCVCCLSDGGLGWASCHTPPPTTLPTNTHTHTHQQQDGGEERLQGHLRARHAGPGVRAALPGEGQRADRHLGRHPPRPGRPVPEDALWWPTSMASPP